MKGFRGDMWGAGLRFGRKLAAGDLQLIILALLDEQPGHGYDLIKRLEERTGGFYVPSPGVIYPALTYLEEGGLADVETEGTRKLYSITEAGRQKVEENRTMIDFTFKNMENFGTKMAAFRRAFDPAQRGRPDEDDFFGPGNDHDKRGGRHGRGHAHGRGPGRGPDGDDEVSRARQLLKSAMRMRFPWPPEEGKRIAGILERAATEILQGGEKRD